MRPTTRTVQLLLVLRVVEPLVGDKVALGMGYHDRTRYALVLFFEKGKRKLSDLSVADVLAHKWVWRGYPTDKPVELASVLVRQSARPGELDVDPFTGSGSFGVAAQAEGCGSLGVDTRDEALSVARRRLEEAGGPVADGLPPEPTD